MTIVVAVKKDNEIIIGADQRCTYGDMILDEYASKILIKEFDIIHYRLPHDKDQFLIAFSGAYSLFGLLETFEAPSMDDNDTFFQYLYKELIPSLNTHLRRYNFIQDCNGLEGVDWDLLIVYQDKMYNIEFNLGIIEITSNYFATGTAKDIAYGSLYTTTYTKIGGDQRKISPRLQVITAIRACAKHHTKCNDSYKLYHSGPNEDGEYEIKEV